MYKVNSHRFLVSLLSATKTVGVAISKLVVGLGSFLAICADTSGEMENDVSAGALKGGTLNYRTGKLDDGTDPHGWYEQD